MKIKSIKTFVIDCFRTNWVFVKVLTDEGIEGIGEGTLEYKENALLATRTTATPTGAAGLFSCRRFPQSTWRSGTSRARR